MTLHIVKPSNPVPLKAGGGFPTRQEEGAMAEKMTALAAYPAGMLALPPGCDLEHGADVLLLRRETGRPPPRSAPEAWPQPR